MLSLIQFDGVQTADFRNPRNACQTDDNLESLVHPAHRRLNICENMRLHGAGPQGILPSQPNRCAGPISPLLNPDTASGHTVAETWAARLRAMLPVGHARTTKLTGQQKKEKFGSLNGARLDKSGDCTHEVNSGMAGNGVSLTMQTTQGKYGAPRTLHSGNQPFLFSFTLGVLRKQKGACRTALLYFHRGGFPCFLLSASLLLSHFLRLCGRSVLVYAAFGPNSSSRVQLPDCRIGTPGEIQAVKPPPCGVPPPLRAGVSELRHRERSMAGGCSFFPDEPRGGALAFRPGCQSAAPAIWLSTRHPLGFLGGAWATNSESKSDNAANGCHCGQPAATPKSDADELIEVAQL